MVIGRTKRLQERNLQQLLQKKCLRQTQPAIRDTAAHHMLILTRQTLHTHQYAILTEIGILSGDGNSEFRPNDPILVNEASKMIMCALGYQDACEITNGGFPNGYTTFALRQGIYNGLELELY